MFLTVHHRGLSCIFGESVDVTAGGLGVFFVPLPDLPSETAQPILKGPRISLPAPSWTQPFAIAGARLNRQFNAEQWPFELFFLRAAA